PPNVAPASRSSSAARPSASGLSLRARSGPAQARTCPPFADAPFLSQDARRWQSSSGGSPLPHERFRGCSQELSPSLLAFDTARTILWSGVLQWPATRVKRNSHRVLPPCGRPLENT